MSSQSTPCRLAAGLFIALVFMLGAASAASAAAPTAAATPSYRWLAGLSCTSITSCMAAGVTLNQAQTADLPLAEKWNGKSWALTPLRLPSGAKTSSSVPALNGVSCPVASGCVAVGSYETASGKTVPLAETWNGHQWAPAAPPAPKGAAQAALNAVACRTPRSCVAVGDFGQSASYGNEKTFAATWNGTKWAVADPGAAGILSGVSCPAASYCVAVGDGWAGSAPAAQPPLIETWNGAKWTAVKAPAPKGNRGAALSAVSCYSAKSCVATGDYHLASGNWVALAETWNGIKWTAGTPPTPSGSNGYYLDLLGVSCIAAKTCLAVGEYGGAGYEYGNAYAESWNGTAWKASKVPAAGGSGNGNGSRLTGVRCFSAASCAAVGLYGPGGGESYGYSAFWNGKAWKLIPA